MPYESRKQRKGQTPRWLLVCCAVCSELCAVPLMMMATLKLS